MHVLQSFILFSFFGLHNFLNILTALGFYDDFTAFYTHMQEITKLADAQKIDVKWRFSRMQSAACLAANVLGMQGVLPPSPVWSMPVDQA
jgi:hypothetical protein